MREPSDDLLLELVDFILDEARLSPQEIAQKVVLLKVKSEFLRTRARRKKPAPAVTLENGEVVSDGT